MRDRGVAISLTSGGFYVQLYGRAATSIVPPPTSARFEFRIRPDVKRRIEHAADLVNESASDFARTAAEHRAEAVLLEHDAITLVPADYFDQLRAALDEPPRPSEALRRAAQRARRTVRQ